MSLPVSTQASLSGVAKARTQERPIVSGGILITGGSGSLGKELQKVFPESYAPTHADMDVTNYKQTVGIIAGQYRPDVIIHTAAIIDARKCEEDWQLASKVNVGGTFNVAKAAIMCDATLIHISSTCVFDGEHAPFDEESKPAPKNWYALTKFAAEQVVMASQANHLIVRTNFAPKETWKYPKAFTDRYGTYLFAPDVAHAVRKVMDMKGLVHVCGDKKMSMFELAKMTTPGILPMTLEEYHKDPNAPSVSRDMSLVSKRIAPFKIGEY